MMFKHALTTLAAIALVSTVALAQPAQPPAQPEKKADAAPAQAARAQGQAVNVLLDLTISEHRTGPGLPAKRVAILVADREYGRVRSTMGNAVLNADARPEILNNGRIRVTLSLEYRRQAQDGVDKATPSLMTQSMVVILEDGKSTVLSQSADPVLEPVAVQVELKATISK